MKQQLFEEQNGAQWQAIEQALDKRKRDEECLVLTDSYAMLCRHLALAKQRLYSSALTERLNKLAMRVYRELYRHQSSSRFNVYGFLLRGFPAAIYLHRRYIAAALLMFLLPGIVAGIWVFVDQDAIYAILDGGNVRMIEQMYDPSAEKFGREDESDTDVFMFGFYVQNNISVAFRCFAGGLLAGIGSLLVLLYNGLHIGAIAGHLTRLDYVDTFYPFVVGHGSFELTAIVFSGAAGLRLGYALLSPGQYSRLDALRISGKDTIPMLYGIILMLLIAAFIEAFWSSSAQLAINVKYTVGGLLWLFVVVYCLSGWRVESR